MEDIINKILEYSYWGIFGGTLIDHSGIPVFIVSGVILYKAKKIELILIIIVGYVALLLSDIITIIIGRYFYKKRLKNNKIQCITKITIIDLFMKKIENNNIVEYCTTKRYYFLFLSKFMPIIGKYFPFIICYEKKITILEFFLLQIGNILYLTTFTLLSIIIGKILLENNKIIGILLLMLMILGFAILKLKLKNRMKKSQLEK